MSSINFCHPEQKILVNGTIFSSNPPHPTIVEGQVYHIGCVEFGGKFYMHYHPPESIVLTPQQLPAESIVLSTQEAGARLKESNNMA